jgi:hypothetical protein
VVLICLIGGSFGMTLLFFLDKMIISFLMLKKAFPLLIETAILPRIRVLSCGFLLSFIFSISYSIRDF